MDKRDAKKGTMQPKGKSGSGQAMPSGSYQ